MRVTRETPTHPDCLDFQAELGYWREHYQESSFYSPGFSFEDYEPALKLGIHAFLHGAEQPFEHVLPELRDDYDRVRGSSPFGWSQAVEIAKAAWQRPHDRLRAR